MKQRDALDRELKQAQGQLHSTQTTASEQSQYHKQMEAEWRRMNAQQLEAEREARIEHIQKIAARRVQNIKLARGWNAWEYLYQRRARINRVLRGATGRLLHPKLAACHTFWRHDYQSTEAARLAQERQKQVADRMWQKAQQADALQVELAEVRKERQRAQDELAALRMAAAEGRSLDADRQRELLEQIEREREARLEHLQRVAAGRIANRSLSRGWSAWLERYLVARRIRGLVLASTGRLLKPKLAAAHAHWRQAWLVSERIAAVQRRETALTRQRAAFDNELGQVQSQLVRTQHVTVAKMPCTC